MKTLFVRDPFSYFLDINRFCTAHSPPFRMVDKKIVGFVKEKKPIVYTLCEREMNSRK